MSPIDKWGPATWAFIHTLSVSIKPEKIHILGPQMFAFIIRICNNLPCPTCSEHAKSYINKLMKDQSFIKDKQKFINAMYIFHNEVNKRLKKQMFKYENILPTYEKNNIILIFNTFSKYFNNKNNLNVILENFHRKRLIMDIKRWLLTNINNFNLPKP